MIEFGVKSYKCMKRSMEVEAREGEDSIQYVFRSTIVKCVWLCTKNTLKIKDKFIIYVFGIAL